jgi:3',5'-cyclic AMP phosphodiesterase CpdA
MRTIAHLSDLHFGTEDRAAVVALLADLAAQAPDLVVVSGDLTQRARTSEFRAAAEFLEKIAARKLVVPGNHDIPLFDLLRRALRPLERFQRHIEPDLQPWHVDPELAVAGLSTPRRNRWKEGRVSLSQLEEVRERFCALGDERLKVVVTHHPFVPKEGRPREDPERSAAARMPLERGVHALGELGSCGADLLLSGHQHVGRQSLLNAWYPDLAHSMLVVEAGTAISRRRRGEPNAYNRIDCDGDRLSVEVRAWDGARFASAPRASFVWQDGGWRLASTNEPIDLSPPA